MKLGKLFDLNREPPTVGEINAAKKKKSLQRFLLMSAIFLGGLLTMICGSGFLAQAIGAAAVLFVCFFPSAQVNRKLQSASDSDMQILLDQVENSTLDAPERVYIQRVFAEGREFRRYEVDILIESMESRAALRNGNDIRAQLAAAVNLPTSEQEG